MAKTTTKAKKATPTPTPPATTPDKRTLKPHELVLSPTIQSAVAIEAWSKFAGTVDLADLVERVAKEAETPRGKVRELIERYASEHATCPDALWMETRTRLNNARHISLRPTC